MRISWQEEEVDMVVLARSLILLLFFLLFFSVISERLFLFLSLSVLFSR